ncbi:MAG TPA: hypothetical protein VHK27_13995, partial [Gammaproteobacteria bacterium]|nr:hypothetical protein [Gammaproteobacteria bacterium]
KRRLFARPYMSYADFKHATGAAKHVLEARLHENPVLRVSLEALSRAMAITYTQPFSNNNRPSKARVADLPSRFHTPQ